MRFLILLFLCLPAAAQMPENINDTAIMENEEFLLQKINYLNTSKASLTGDNVFTGSNVFVDTATMVSTTTIALQADVAALKLSTAPVVRYTEWDTAYGWGDHAGAGYATQANLTSTAAALSTVILSTGALDAAKVNKAGDSMTGPLTMTASSITITGGAAFGAASSTATVYSLTISSNATISGAVQINDRLTISSNTVLSSATFNGTITTAYAVNSSSNINAANYQINGSTGIRFLGSSNSTMVMGPGAGAGLRSNGDNNIFFGVNTGSSCTTCQNNILMGYQAGAWITANDNVLIITSGGGGKITSGGGNVGIGKGVLATLTTSGGNLAIGYQAGYYNTAANNVFLGYTAGQGNTSGTANNIIGRAAGYTNSVGIKNTIFGDGAGYAFTGSNNTMVGEASGTNVLAASDQTLIGKSAGYNITTGDKNTSVGSLSMYSGKTGSNNVAVGYNAGRGNVSSYSSSTLVGYQAGYSLTSGGDNIFAGFQAGYAVTTGSGNIIIGYNQQGTANSTNTLIIGNIVTGSMDAAAKWITNSGTMSITGMFGETGLKVSSNVYIVGYSSAATYWGSGANLSGVSVLASTQIITGGKTFASSVTVQGILALQNAYTENTSSGSTGAVTTFNVSWSSASIYRVTLATNTTLTFSSDSVGMTQTFSLAQDSIGGWSVTWPAAVDWGSGGTPTISTEPFKVTYCAVHKTPGGAYHGLPCSRGYTGP